LMHLQANPLPYPGEKEKLWQTEGERGRQENLSLRLMERVQRPVGAPEPAENRQGQRLEAEVHPDFYPVKSWALCSAGCLVFPEEADELEHLVTSRTESVSIDHPNHIVTVTTISDLDLSGARQLGLTSPKGEEVVNKPVRTMPKKSRNPFLSEKISSLTATLHMHSRKKTKGKRSQRGQGPRKKIQKSSTGRTTKTQRRRLTGKMGRDQD
uniref:Nucleolar protein 12 n=1 Tax=Cyanistes caeruleus TaxID=156563 RepID=A0A8C0U9Z0_CYACU